MLTVSTLIYSHIQKNDSWRTLIADIKIGFDIERYPQWKYAGEQGYPMNEYGNPASNTNYERSAWFKVGIALAVDHPLGYGLVEDSFKYLVKNRWPEASPRLSHSHSGWLDLILGVGLPGFFCILFSLLASIWQSSGANQPWNSLVFWSLLANLILWSTTEVAATTSFSALIFWVALASGLMVVDLKQLSMVEISKEFV